MKLRKKKAYEAAVAGFFADIGEALGEELFADYRTQVMPILLADVNNPKATPTVLRNSGFALGQIFLKTSVDAAKEYYESASNGLQQGLKIIQDAIDAAEDKTSSSYEDLHGAKDNVVAALGRLLMVGADHLPRATLVATLHRRSPIDQRLCRESTDLFRRCQVGEHLACSPSGCH